MLDSNQLGHVLRLRGFDPMLDLVADVLVDMFSSGSAEHVGQATFKGNPIELNIGVEPIDRAKLSYGLPSVVTIDHPHGFHKPGNEGPNGGIALKIRGPSTMTPNRPGDLVLSAPEGGIDAGQIYVDGVPIPPPIEIPDTGTWIVIYEDGVPTLIEGEEC